MAIKTVAQWLSAATSLLKLQAHEQTARLDAELLVSEVTRKSRALLFAHPEATLERHECQRLDDMLQRRCSGEPMAYITGKREFWSVNLDVEPGVLVPRPDSELLVETGLKLLPRSPNGPIVDLGTGTGAIAIALATEIADRTIIALERDDKAISVASTNIRKHVRQKVQLVQADWLSSLSDQSLAMIIANPPYLAKDDPHLAGLHYEPITALVSEHQGLNDLDIIIRQSLCVGMPGAAVIVEHGCEQGQSVQTILRGYGYHNIHTVKDLAGLDRVSYGFVPNQES